MRGLWKKFTEGGGNSTTQGLKIQVEKEIAAALAPLMAEMLKPIGFSKASTQIANSFFEKHLPQVVFKDMVQPIETHMLIGAQPFLKISCKQLHNMLDAVSCQTIVYFLLQLAAADDFIHARKMRIAHRIAGYLGVAENDFNVIKSQFLSKNNPYFLLELEETASLAEVKKAYRRMVLKFHPDKRAAHISEKEAHEKFLQIQAAFEAIAQGYSLE